MKKYFTPLVVVLILVTSSCGKYSYPENGEVSDKAGILLDTIKGYLPTELTFDGVTHAIQWEPNRLNELNHILLTSQEVVLYNFYLDRDIYRIVLKEEGESPLILHVSKPKKGAWLVSKKLTTDSLQTSELDSIQMAQAPVLKSNFDNYSKTWNPAHIQRFDSLYTATNFFEQPIGETEKAFENYYLIEVHQSDKYWYIYRPLEDSTFAPLIKFTKSFSRF